MSPLYQYRRIKKTLEKIQTNHYAEIMTLQDRNILLKTGIVLSFLLVIFSIAASIVLIPVYSSFDMENFRRPAGLFQKISGSRLEPNLLAVHISIIVLAVYSLIALILIFFYFEKTQSPEIPFIAFFVLSLSFESARLIVPLQQLLYIPSFYQLMASRSLIFGRNFGLFSLFAASIYAAGLEAQRQRNIVFISAIAALVIALGTPVDTFTRYTNFEPMTGYASIFQMLNAGILLMTTLGFLISAYLQRSKDFIFISAGAFLVLAGRNFLIMADTWAGLSGITLLVLGIWVICIYLHKVYLWL